MTSKISQLQQFGSAVRAALLEKRKGYFAVLGTLAGEVLTGVANLVYITTFEGQTLTVINRRVPNQPGAVVFVGADEYSANQTEILYTLNVEGQTNDGSGTGSANIVPPHDHSYGSLDPTWVSDAQFMDLLVLPISGTSTVQVYHGAVRKTDSAGWKYIDDQVVDLSGDIPESGACWALLQANDDGTVDAVIGSTQTDRASLTEDDIPEATTGKGIVAIVLEEGYTEFFRDNTRNDFLDLRFDKAGGGGGTGTDSDAIHGNVAGEINALTEKTTPISGDLLIIEDSADSNNKKKVQAGNIPASDANAIHDNVASEISALTEKTTPISGDLLVIEDSADSNNKKKLQVGNLASVSGTISWSQVINESGASFTNWTGVSGTWSSDGTVIKQTNTSATARYAIYNPKVVTSLIVFEAEIQLRSSGALRLGGILVGVNSSGVGGADIRLDEGNDLIQLENSSTVILSISATIAVNTWYKVRVVKSGIDISVYLDGTLKATAAVTSGADVTYVGLYSYQAEVWYRNIKAWNLNLP